MTMTIPSRKKTKEIRSEETSQESIGNAFLESLKNQPSTFFIPAMLYCDPGLYWEEDLETEEEEEEEPAEKELGQDFLLDDPLKDVDDGDIVEDDEEADTSDQSMRKKPKLFGPDLEKSKRTPRMLIEKGCPKPSVHKVERKVTRMRKLQLATRNMNMTVPNRKKTKEIRREETSQKSIEDAFLERLKKQSRTFVYPAMFYRDPDLEAEEEKQAEMEVMSKKLSSSVFRGGFLMDDPLKDVDDGDIVEDIEGAGTSDQSIKPQPKVRGPDLGKSKRTQRMLIENSCPKLSVHKVKRKETRMRKLQLKARFMATN